MDLLLTRLLGEALVLGLLVRSVLYNLYFLVLSVIIGGVGVSVNSVMSATSYQ